MISDRIAFEKKNAVRVSNNNLITRLCSVLVLLPITFAVQLNFGGASFIYIAHNAQRGRHNTPRLIIVTLLFSSRFTVRIDFGVTEYPGSGRLDLAPEPDGPRTT